MQRIIPREELYLRSAFPNDESASGSPQPFLCRAVEEIVTDFSQKSHGNVSHELYYMSVFKAAVIGRQAVNRSDSRKRRLT